MRHYVLHICHHVFIQVSPFPTVPFSDFYRQTHTQMLIFLQKSLNPVSILYTKDSKLHFSFYECGSVFITDCVQLVSVEVWLLFPLSTLILPSCTDSGPLVSTLANTVILLVNVVGCKNEIWVLIISDSSWEDIILHWHSGSHKPCCIWEAIALQSHAEFLFHSNFSGFS